jgi:hypothetical protein
MLAFLQKQRIEVDGTIANRCVCTILAVLMWDRCRILDRTVNYCNKSLSNLPQAASNASAIGSPHRGMGFLPHPVGEITHVRSSSRRICISPRFHAISD